MNKPRNKIYEHMVRYNLRNKDYAIRKFREIMLNKTQQIFEYDGLPDTVPQDVLEHFLQAYGNVFFHKVRGELYVFTGGLGGEPDVYYRPTLYTIANPALNYSANAKIGVDGVLMRNDYAMQGLLPIIYKYGSLLIEAEISFFNAIVNTRDYNAMSAGDDATRASAEEYQRQIEAGYTAVIAENQLLEGIRRHPTPTSNGNLTNLRETYQYIKAQLYSDLGMKTSHNMKKQYVSEEENIVNDDTLLPLIDNMLICRQNAVKEINEMFDLNVEVRLRGTWELQQEEVEAAHRALKGEFVDEESESGEETIVVGEEETGNEKEEQSEEEQSEEEQSEEEQSEEVQSEEEQSEEEQREGNVEVNVTVNVEVDEEEEEDEENEKTKGDD